MGIRRKVYCAGWRDGVSHGSPDPRPNGQRLVNAEWGKYYRRGYASGAQLHIAHSDDRGYCTRCLQQTAPDEMFCGNCGAQVKLTHRQPWSFRNFLRERGEL
jgi:hypothetical protein